MRSGEPRPFSRGVSRTAGQIQRIIEGFDKYLHYEGTEDMLPVLKDLAESDG